MLLECAYFTSEFLKGKNDKLLSMGVVQFVFITNVEKSLSGVINYIFGWPTKINLLTYSSTLKRVEKGFNDYNFSI